MPPSGARESLTQRGRLGEGGLAHALGRAMVGDFASKERGDRFAACVACRTTKDARLRWRMLAETASGIAHAFSRSARLARAFADAALASSLVNLCAVPSACAARPPIELICFRSSTLRRAKPRSGLPLSSLVSSLIRARESRARLSVKICN